MRRNLPTLSEFDGSLSWWGGLKGYLLCGFCGILIGAALMSVVYEVRLAHARNRAMEQLRDLFREQR